MNYTDSRVDSLHAMTGDMQFEVIYHVSKSIALGSKIEGARHARKKFLQQDMEAFEHWREAVNFDGI